MLEQLVSLDQSINLVVGAGFSGAVIANLIANELNEQVVVIDKKSHIAGNSYDFKDENGITIHKYGSHIFHTNYDDVWQFLNNYGSFNTYMHRVLAVIDGIKASIPFNINTLYDVFPNSLAIRLEEKLLKNFEYNSKIPIMEFQKTADDDLKFLADFIYNKVFLNYTKKQWGGAAPEMLDGSVSARVPVLISKDTRYFQDKYQGIPVNGYTKLVENILNHKNIKLLTDVKFLKDDLRLPFKRIFYTGAIDELFNYEYGILPFRSVSFKYETYDLESYQNNTVVNYPNNYDFTRIHEYKHYLREKSSKTVIAKEFSTDFKPGVNEPYYPVVNDESKRLYECYKKLSLEYKNLYILGRLGDFKYYDMDKAIRRAFEVFDMIKKGI